MGEDEEQVRQAEDQHEAVVDRSSPHAVRAVGAEHWSGPRTSGEFPHLAGAFTALQPMTEETVSSFPFSSPSL
jgi:hypothetical protein